MKYIWLCFTNTDKPDDAPENMIFMKPTLDILPYIKKADYLVQLSDHEALCYSMAEALEFGTPVIVTPMTVLDEFGIRDGIHGYVIPFDIPQTFDVTKLYKIPLFDYKPDNDESVKRWRKLLGYTIPSGMYKPHEMIRIRCTQGYFDTRLQRKIEPGEEYLVSPDRTSKIVGAGYGIRI